MVQKVSSSTRLRVAEACCDLYLARGTTQLTVAELAGAAGISERTFYRYFPVKAESIAPVFDSMTEAMNAAVVAHGPAPLRAVVVDAFEAMFTGHVPSRAHQIFPLVFADSEMWALFLRKVHDGETTLAPLLAALLGLPMEHDRARAAAAAVASSTRIALERLSAHSGDLAADFAGVLDAFGPALLYPATVQDARASIRRPATISASGPTG